MNKKMIILIATVSMFSLSACDSDAPTPTPAPTPAIEESAAPTETASASEEPMPSEEINPADLAPEFTLSEEETAIYNEYIEKQDISIFKDLNQISIAKVFIKCGIDGNFDAEFKMYAPSTLNGMTYDDYVANSTGDGAEGSNESRQIMANYFFSSIDSGTFVDNGDGTGYISTKSFEEEPYSFNMAQNEDGIWLINFQDVMS